jgi:hypothetical protein
MSSLSEASRVWTLVLAIPTAPLFSSGSGTFRTGP